MSENRTALKKAAAWDKDGKQGKSGTGHKSRRRSGIRRGAGNDSRKKSRRPEGTRKKRRHREVRREDYGRYTLRGTELALNMLAYLLLEGAVGFLFFNHMAAAFLLLAGLPLFLKNREKMLLEKRRRSMRAEFLTGMQLTANALQAGYAIENAFREAYAQLGKVYAPDAFIMREFGRINSQCRLNVPIESVLLDLGERSGVEDIRQFAEVFETARKTGGDLIAITRNTVSLIAQKEETTAEIETALAGKRMEQNLMSVIPLLILAYIRLSSPGFLDPIYQTLAGRAVMCACLACYAAAYLWGRSIMRILVE